MILQPEYWRDALLCNRRYEYSVVSERKRQFCSIQSCHFTIRKDYREQPAKRRRRKKIIEVWVSLANRLRKKTIRSHLKKATSDRESSCPPTHFCCRGSFRSFPALFYRYCVSELPLSIFRRKSDEWINQTVLFFLEKRPSRNGRSIRSSMFFFSVTSDTDFRSKYTINWIFFIFCDVKTESRSWYFLELSGLSADLAFMSLFWFYDVINRTFVSWHSPSEEDISHQNSKSGSENWPFNRNT